MNFDVEEAARRLFSELKQYAADEGDDSVFMNWKYKAKVLNVLGVAIQKACRDEDADLFTLKCGVLDDMERLATEAGNASIFKNENYRRAALYVTGGGIIGEALLDARDSELVY